MATETEDDQIEIPPEPDAARKIELLALGGLLFFWSKSARAYFSRKKTGKKLTPVSAQAVRLRLQTAVDSSKAKLARLTQQMVDGEISVAEWVTVFKDELRAGHRAAAILANGGKLDARAAGQLGAQLKKQYKFLDAFARQIENGEIPLGKRSVARARLYGQAIMNTYEKAVLAREKAAGVTLYKLTLAPAEHCEECVEDSAKGYVPIGSLKHIGDRECLVNCRCHWRYQ